MNVMEFKMRKQKIYKYVYRVQYTFSTEFNLFSFTNL